MSKRDDVPLFSVTDIDDYGEPIVIPGMTLRDWFAGQALAFLAHPARVGVSFDAEGDAEFAYAIADAMLKAREG